MSEETKPAFFAAIEPVEGVVGTFDFVGRDVCVDLFFRDEAEMQRRVRLLAQLAGAEPWEFYDNAVPPVARDLSLLDWRIVKALRHDAKRPLRDIARELRITPRTVKNRFDRMVAERSVWIVPHVDPGKMSGFVPFGALVYARGAGAIAAAREALTPLAMYSWSPPEGKLGQLGAVAQARTMGDVEATRRKLLALPGVERVELLFPSGARLSLAWLDEAIDRRVAELSRLSIGGPATPADGKPAPVAFRARPPPER